MVAAEAWLAPHPILGQDAFGLKDFLIRHRLAEPTRPVKRSLGFVPVGRMANANCCGFCVRIVNCQQVSRAGAQCLVEKDWRPQPEQ